MSDDQHTITIWVDGEDFGFDVRCPYDPADESKPCLMRDWPHGEAHDLDEGEDLPPIVPGCAVIDYLDNGGYEAVRVNGRIESPPVPVLMWWDDYPCIEAMPAAPPETKPPPTESDPT